MFCSDVDGTLLDSGRRLSARTVAAITATRAEGHPFVLCSSRPPASLRLLEAEYGGAGESLIAYNGGLVIDRSGAIVVDVPIAAADARAVVEHCEAVDLHASCFAGERWHAWGADRWTDREIANTGVHPDAMDARAYAANGRVDAQPPHKIMAMGEPELIDGLEALVAPMPGVVAYRPKPTYLEMANTAVSKATGIRAVAESLGIRLADVVFFGDNFNDLPAFEVVGTAVAVGNAKDAVLAAATEVTARGHDDGVAVWLEERAAQRVD
nr:Cof-type HAD-IIB family hydrolase [Agromyces seonyuensis]